MKLSFMPGELHLLSNDDGSYSLTLRGEEILRTKSQKAAVARFKHLRHEMEKQFPVSETSDEEKAAAFRRIIEDTLVQHNSLGGRKKKTTAGGTRTFGG